MARVRAGALDVAYDDVGSGPPVLLVHGGLGNRAAWTPQVRVLSERWRCVVPDLRGHGETRGGEDVEAFTAALLRDDLLAFADALGLESFALVGLSVGGFVAQEVAIAASARLERLVLADTWVATGGAGEGAQRLGRALAPVVEGALRAFGTGPLAALAARTVGSDAEARALVRAATAGTSRESAVRMWRGLGLHDTRGRLGAIDVPTLVIAGERDGMGLAGGRELAETIPGARLQILPGVGHNSNLQAPEAFTKALRGGLVALN